MSAMPHSPSDPRPEILSARFDDLSRRMDNGFNRVDAKLERHGEAIARLASGPGVPMQHLRGRR